MASSKAMTPHAAPAIHPEDDAVVDRFIIEELVAVGRYEARCTIVFDGVRHTLRVQSTLADSELEGVRTEWPPELERRFCMIPGGPDGVYLRDFVEQLCRFFAGEQLPMPIVVQPHNP